MIETLASLTDIGMEAWSHGFMVFLRVGAVMALMPGFGEQVIPQRVRLVVALAFAAVIAPAVPAATLSPAALGAEVLSGLLIGIGLRLFVLGLQTGAAIAAQATSLAQLLGGGGEPQPALGHLLTYAALALAMAADLHLRVAELLILSYDALPAGRLPAPSDMADWGVAQVARAFVMAFSLAAPFVVAALVYNIALGVINRAMPQLMVSFIGAPALTLGGLALIAVTVPLMLAIWLAAFNGYLADPFTIAP